MSVAALVVLGCTAAGGLLLTARGERRRSTWGAAVLTLLLSASGVLAWVAGGASDGIEEAAAVVAVLAAVLGGGPVATAVLRAADPAAIGVTGGPQDPDVLRGGTWIGFLERAAVGATILAGSAEGLVVVLAVKGLGRYAELRAPAAAERFIIGTLASALWAAACVGVAILLRG
ncbi:hypothetical protein E4P39_14200 [Blastococcus sp. CT_GayMR19]|uniref:hypothetical protein n=1 Tax=Blastococcus sp. CT_GayMR19 TaxID=2559608 RepID=UPI001074656B|nr:hypothetical protein [Blastococcus sp. CT_GayMR19]TFV73899.1 hypothetical protein E4P39_14200 [Blastococcus sp. CT_GayMR19]